MFRCSSLIGLEAYAFQSYEVARLERGRVIRDGAMDVSFHPDYICTCGRCIAFLSLLCGDFELRLHKECLSWSYFLTCKILDLTVFCSKSGGCHVLSRLQIGKRGCELFMRSLLFWNYKM